MEPLHHNAHPLPSLDSLRNQLLLLQELAEMLERAPQALLARDLPRIELHTGHLRVVCRELLELLSGRAHSNAFAAIPASGVQQRALLQAIVETSARAHYAAQVYAALLRRAQRTNRIFSRLLASAAVTYDPSQAHTAAGGGQS